MKRSDRLNAVLRELRALAREEGYLLSERASVGGLTLYLRQRAFSLDARRVELQTALALARREHRGLTDRETGDFRVRLSDVRRYTAGLSSWALGDLLREAGLRLVERGGDVWVLCDAAWHRFLPSVRTPVQ